MDKLKNIKILIVHYDINVLFHIECELKRIGIETQIAFNGVEAYKLLYKNENEFDYIIINIGLPDENGVEIVKFIKNKYKSKVIIYTNKPFKDYKNKCEYDYYLQRNKYTIHDVINIIKNDKKN